MPRTLKFPPAALPILAILGLSTVLAGCTPSTDSFNSTMVDRNSAEFKRDADTSRYFYMTTGRKRPEQVGTGEFQEGEQIQYTTKVDDSAKAGGGKDAKPGDAKEAKPAK